MIRPIFSTSRLALFVGVLVLLGGSTGGSSDLSGRPPSTVETASIRPIAVEVDRGRASIQIPTPIPGSRSLVIVSALARRGGPFPIRLVARPIDHPGPIARVQDRTVDRPRSILPDLVPVPRPVAGLPADRRTFHLMARGGDVSLASSYLAVEARLTAVGRRVQVYVDVQDLGVVQESTLRDVVETFDEGVYPALAGRFGPANDVDRDGRFTLFFTSWLTRLAGGRTSVDGFVRGADLDLGVGEPFGNRCDMMYLSASLEAGPHLRTILAHEYTHAVNFSRKSTGAARPGREEEGWLDEGSAHLAEDALGYSRSNLDYRVSAFLSRPERYRLVVDDYYAANLFRSHGNRGATYLFLRWCVDQYGPGLLDSLVRSTDCGLSNLEAATGATFADLFRRWTIALALGGRSEQDTPVGPRMTRVVVGGSADAWSAEATTVHYSIVEGSSSGAVAMEVVGPAEAELQVSVIPWPSGSGLPDRTDRVAPPLDGVSRFGTDRFGRSGQPVRLGAMSWGTILRIEGPRSPRSIRGGLGMLGVASTFGPSVVAGPR